MINAFVLMSADRTKINAIAEELTNVEGVSEVYSVAGGYDIIAVIRVAKNEDLAEIVTNRMIKIEGILKTQTLIAFRAFSRHDLESMFSVT